MRSRANRSTAPDPKRAAVAKFAQHVIETRDQVSDADIAAARDVGYTAAETRAIVTITGVVPLTNYLNNVNDTIVDIPDAGAQAP